MRPTRVVAAVALVALTMGCTANSKTASTANDVLAGVFRITAGACKDAAPTGSWFRMVQPGGTPSSGPYVSNPDSGCADTTFTSLSPGDDGGLRSGAFQPQPDPPFDATGGSAAKAVIRPQAFFAVQFGASTNQKDPQTGATVKPPTITRSGSTLGGDLSAFSVSWNQQQFNQGAPKPGGSTTGGPKGTYDQSTHTYTLDWTSRIDGGPFNGFTGVWHLEGTFQPA